jgi:plasmid rolling circle replication initiator protein Rep
MSTVTPDKSNRNPHQSQDYLSLEKVVDNTAIWGLLKASSVEIARMLKQDSALHQRAKKMRECARTLFFAEHVERATGIVSNPFHHTFRCHDKLCPVCQWRRALQWRTRLYNALQSISSPQHLIIFPTLTVLDPDVTALKTTLQKLSKAWASLVRRRLLSGNLGWFWTIEVKRGEGDFVHPHLHALLILPRNTPIPPIKWWQEAWSSSLSVAYKPRVSVPRMNTTDIAQVAEYLFKVEDITIDPPYYIALAHQLTDVRLLSSGGMLKAALKHTRTPPQQEQMTTGLRAAWSGTSYNIVSAGSLVENSTGGEADE